MPSSDKCCPKLFKFFATFAASSPIDPEVSTTKRMSAAPGPSFGSTLVFGAGGRQCSGTLSGMTWPRSEIGRRRRRR